MGFSKKVVFIYIYKNIGDFQRQPIRRYLLQNCLGGHFFMTSDILIILYNYLHLIVFYAKVYFI